MLKVEPPTGDDSRGWLPFTDPGDDQQSVSTYFLSANRGKRSVRLDLKQPDDVARLRELCAEADVLVENYRPGLMARLGLDPADLRRDNPRLVTLSITGFGTGGPDGQRPGFDQIVQAEAGLMSLTGVSRRQPDTGRPAHRRPACGHVRRVRRDGGARRPRAHRHGPRRRDVAARRGHVGARVPRRRLAGRRRRAGPHGQPAPVDRPVRHVHAAPTPTSSSRSARSRCGDASPTVVGSTPSGRTSPATPLRVARSRRPAGRDRRPARGSQGRRRAGRARRGRCPLRADPVDPRGLRLGAGPAPRADPPDDPSGARRRRRARWRGALRRRDSGRHAAPAPARRAPGPARLPVGER